MEAIEFVLDSDKAAFKKFIEDITKDGEKHKNCTVLDGCGFSKRKEITISDMSIGDIVCVKYNCLTLKKKIKKIFFGNEKIIILGFYDGFYDVYEGIVQVVIYLKNKKIGDKFYLIGIDCLENIKKRNKKNEKSK